MHRVWRNATLLMDDYPEADALVVLAACYLHDLVNLPKNSPDRHLASRQAARLASRRPKVWSSAELRHPRVDHGAEWCPETRSDGWPLRQATNGCVCRFHRVR